MIRTEQFSKICILDMIIVTLLWSFSPVTVIDIDLGFNEEISDPTDEDIESEANLEEEPNGFRFLGVPDDYDDEDGYSPPTFEAILTGDGDDDGDWSWKP